MKRLLSLMLVAILLFSCFAAALPWSISKAEAADEDISSLIFIYNNYHDADNLVNPIANVQKVSSADANLSNLSVAWFDLTTDIDATSAFSNCVNAKVVPTFYITSNAQADKVVSAIKTVGNIDVNVVSNTKSVLTYIRGKAPEIRTGLYLDISAEMADGKLTQSEAHEIRYTVRSSPATVLVIDSKYATKQAVNEIQEFTVAVWAIISSASGTDAFNLEVVKALTAGVQGVVSASASNVSNLIKTHFLPNAFTRTPLLVGHAGNPDIVTEDTIASFQSAYNHGADYFEVDTGVTKDGVVFLMHDNTLNRTTTYTGTKNIVDMTWDEVKQYNIKNLDGTDSGKAPPTLEEFLTWAKGKDVKILLEFKTYANNAIPNGMKIVNDLDMVDQMTMYSFYGYFCELARKETPEITTGMPTYNKVSTETYAQSLSLLYNTLLVIQTDQTKTVNQYNSTISPQNYLYPISRNFVQAAADRGLTISPWTFSHNDASDAFFKGFDSMTMNNAQDFAEMVKLVHANDFSLYVGQTYGGGALVSETYNDTFTPINANDTVVSVISGDSVKVENGKLVGVKAGKSTVILGNRTKTYMGKEYIVYSEPVTVTVTDSDAASLKPLMKLAETATVNSLPESELDYLRTLYAKAEALVNSSAPSVNEIKSTATAMSALLNGFISKSYTTTTPNYYYGGDNPYFCDDGIRLIDGKKSDPNGGSSAYSAWGKTETGTIEMILDLGISIENDTFNAYFASGDWGVANPADFKISVSNDGINWESIDSDFTKSEPIKGTNAWVSTVYTVKSASAVKARYIKYTVTPGHTNGFIWCDEIEALNSSETEGFPIYINGINTPITAGKASIFTSAFNPLTNDRANITWSKNVIAKWDSKEKAYVVKSIADGNVDAINLASDEILIAAHDWESSTDGMRASVKGSAANVARLGSAKIGQKIVFFGIDIESRKLGIAPGIKIVDEIDVHQHSPMNFWHFDTTHHWQECSCGEKSNLSVHDEGSWVEGKDGGDCYRELRCTVCDYVISKEIIPEIPKENEDSSDDSSNDPTEDPSEDPTEDPSDDPSNDPSDDPSNPGNEPEPEDPPLEEPEFVKGDINGKDGIDSMDYVLLKRAYFGTYTLKDIRVGDINNNEIIDSMDYVYLRRAYFGTYVIK